MHAPPAVAYPVGRPPELAFALTLVGAAGLVLCLATAWTNRSDAGLLQGWLVVLGVVALGALAGIAWRQLLRGSLNWDGQAWRLDPPVDRGASLAFLLERVDVVDLSFALLIRVRVVRAAQDLPGAGAQRWLACWIWAARRDGAPDRWHALRCAALASGRPVPGPVEPIA
jgi:hypothetical protein